MAKLRTQLLPVAVLLLLWQVLAWLRLWPPHLFPAPSDVAVTLWRLAASNQLAEAIFHTLRRVGLGFGLAALGGGVLGLLMARSRTLSHLAGPLVQGLQAMPSICWYPLAFLWLGRNEGTLLIVTIAGALFAIAWATEGGIRNIPPSYLRAAATMGARGWRLYSRVVIPAALPSLVTGLRLGWSFAWRSLMAAELLFLNLGLGHLLVTGQDLGDGSQVVAVILVILTVGVLVDRLFFARAERALRERWGYETTA